MYENSHIRFDEFACPIKITKTNISSYSLVFPKKLGEFSVTIHLVEEDMRLNPVSNLLTGLQASLSRSEFAPRIPFEISGQKTEMGTWILYRTNQENEVSYQYAFDSDKFWLDVRGFCKANKLFTFESLSNWIKTGIIVKGKGIEG